MRKQLNAAVWQENEWFIAQCLEVDVASQGETQEEALHNLHEALTLHFTPPVATVMPSIQRLEIEVAAA